MHCHLLLPNDPFSVRVCVSAQLDRSLNCALRSSLQLFFHQLIQCNCIKQLGLKDRENRGEEGFPHPPAFFHHHLLLTKRLAELLTPAVI